MLSTEAKLTDLVSRLRELAGDNLESLVLYGSAARGDFKEGHSDLNILCLLRSVAPRELARISLAIHWWSHDRKEPAPLVLTVQELRASADVFPIELLDMQRSHRVLYGADLVSAISVPMNLHRIQVERDLRALLLKLRQHLLLAGQHDTDLRAAAAKSASSAHLLLRHVLIAFGEEAPSDPHAVFARIAALTSADAAPLSAVFALRDSNSHSGEVVRLYGEYINALSVIISALDKRIPKREWQRTGLSGS